MQNNALRVTVDGFTPDQTEAYEVSFTHVLPSSLTVNDGDQVFASIWARSANEDGTTGQVGVRIQEGRNFSGVEQVWEVNSNWKPLLFPVEVNFEGQLNSNVERSIDIRLAYQNQTIELADFRFLRLPTDTDLSALPQAQNSYIGRHADAPWRQEIGAESRVLSEGETVSVQVVDADGTPIPGVVVSAQPIEFETPLGTTINPDRVDSQISSIADSTDSERYRQIATKYFETITDSYAGQWGPWEESQSRAEITADWVVENDLTYHGHSILWGELNDLNFPNPTRLYDGYQALIAADSSPSGLATASQWMRDEILDYAQTTGPAAAFAGTRPGSTDPIVDYWDVLNHPILHPQVREIVGDEFILELLTAVRQTVHPETDLIINEFDILSNPDGERADAFFAFLNWLDLNAQDGSADYDAIGFQGHFVSSDLPSIEDIQQSLTQFESLGRSFHLTEFDVDGLFVDEQTRADFTRDFFTSLGNFDIDSATYWGFWAGDHWRESQGQNEQAASFNLDWSPRPAGQWLLDAIDERRTPETWTTTEDSIDVSLHGESFQLGLDIDGFRSEFALIPESSPSTIVLDEVQMRTFESGAGVLMQDHLFGNNGEAFLMYSDQVVQDRFAGMSDLASDHFVTVRWIDGQWLVDNNLSDAILIPESTDRLVAKIDLRTASIEMLAGLNVDYQGISLGYVSGDLEVTADTWRGQPQQGELGITGTRLFFSTESPEGTYTNQLIETTPITTIGDLDGNGIAEVVVVYRDPVTDRDHISAIDPITSQRFYDREVSLTVSTIDLEAYVDASGADQLLWLLEYRDDQRSTLQLRDAATGTRTEILTAFPQGYEAIDIETFQDSTGQPHAAILGVDLDTGFTRIKTINLVTGIRSATFVVSTQTVPIDLEIVQDDLGIDQFVVLEQRNVRGRAKLQLQTRSQDGVRLAVERIDDSYTLPIADQYLQSDGNHVFFLGENHDGSYQISQFNPELELESTRTVEGAFEIQSLVVTGEDIKRIDLLSVDRDTASTWVQTIDLVDSVPLQQSIINQIQHGNNFATTGLVRVEDAETSILVLAQSDDALEQNRLRAAIAHSGQLLRTTDF